MLTLLQLGAVVIVTITCNVIVPVTTYEYRITVLLPLTGPHHLEGNLIKAGINIAWKENVAKLNTPRDVEVDIVYEDTKCSEALERNLISRHLADTLEYGQLLVFSYRCSSNVNSSLAALGLLNVPLVSFGSDVSLNKLGFIAKQLVPGVFEKLSYLLIRNNWTRVGINLLSGKSSLEEILVQELESRSIEVHRTECYSSTLQRVWIFVGDSDSITNALCSIKEKDKTSNKEKFVWIVPTTDASEVHNSIIRKCGGFLSGSILLFQVNKLDIKVPSYFNGKLKEEGIISDNHLGKLNAAEAYDVSRLVLETVHKVSRNADRRQFGTDFFTELVNSEPFDGLTGNIEFDQLGVRLAPHKVYKTQGDSLEEIDEKILLEMGPSTASSETKLDGIPLWMFALMSSLAILGMIYAIAIIIFNIAKAKNKIIKMTSPNINIVMLIGAILGYGCIIILGLDSGYVNESTMEKLQTATVFILALGFTIIYGCLFAKSWRVFLVFKNINFNGKLTRDEHLLIGILVMLIIDLGILLPWYFVDPIKCTRRTISTVYEADSISTVTYEVDDCYSELQGLWIALLYIYKLLLIIAGLYFTWQTRNITLPSLKDTKLIYIVVYTVIISAIIALPTIMISYVGMKTRYASGGLIIWIVLTVTITVLFVPKIILERKNRDASRNVSSFNFLFSESMRKTQEAVRKCSLCFCCGEASDSDRYVQEMLANEIDTLKRTIKQKDSTIRELNDRLYIGTEKFQEYLTAPKSHRSVLHAMQEKYEARKNRQQHPQQGRQEQSKIEDNISTKSNTNQEITIHCPKPVTANGNGYIPSQEQSPHVFTSAPHNTAGEFDNQRQTYEDEGIHSSDSYSKQISDVPYRQDIPPNQANNTHLVNYQNTYIKPIQTVSNGYIPTRSNSSAACYSNYSRKHSQGSLGSQRSLHQHSSNYYQQQDNTQPANYQHQQQEYRMPSPNQDSAFDDNTPSSDGYDKYQSGNEKNSGYVSTGSKQSIIEDFQSYHDYGGGGGIAQDRQFSQIDIGAMEYDAVRNFQRTPSIGHKYEPSYHKNDYYNSNTMPKTKMSVSQI